MNILITVFQIMDYGGIVNHVELLIRGFQEEGHNCTLVMLRDMDRDPYVRRDTKQAGAYKSITGGQAHTLSGWFGIEVIGYGSLKRIKQWKRLTDEYDLVIHEVPGPKPDKAGLWKKIYDIDTPQIIIAHDAHFRTMYPHLALIADKIEGIACTNHAGYVALDWFPAPRAFVGAPHVPRNWERMVPWKKRAKIAVSAHVWKAWKHMDMVVRAAPHMKSQLILGGDGIEGRYMRSKDKCKPRYKGIWKKAISSGAIWLGLMTPAQLREAYWNSRVMVDMSWSKKFMPLGNHFNRSIIEAFNVGVVPICVKGNMIDKTPAQVKLWRSVGSMRNYVPVSKDATPKELAQIIDETVNMRPADAEVIINNGRDILREYFDYRVSARGFLRLAAGKNAGVYPKLETGRMPKGFEEQIDAYLHSNAR